MTELQIIAEPGVPQVFTTRTFDAPRALVYRAFTEPDLLVQWLGPRKYTMTIERYDLRDGGTYRYIHADDAGNAYAFHGVFHGEPSPDGMVQTFEFEGAPGNVSLDSLATTASGAVCVGTLGHAGESGGVSVFRPEAEQAPVERLAFPDPMVTNICFGGPDMRTAFMTFSITGKLVRARWPEPGLKLNFQQA